MPTTVRLNPRTEQRLRDLAKSTGRTQSYYINEMIESSIDRLEWEQGLLQLAADVRAGRVETVSSEEMDRALGLEGVRPDLGALEDVW